MKSCKRFLCIYCTSLLVLLFGIRLGTQPGIRLNLRPFDTIMRYFWVIQHGGNRTQLMVAYVNLVGNLLLFVPLGYLLPCCFEWRGLKSVLALVAICLGVELAQFVTGLGTCDVDDCLLNFAGALFGLQLWRMRKNNGTF